MVLKGFFQAQRVSQGLAPTLFVAPSLTFLQTTSKPKITQALLSLNANIKADKQKTQTQNINIMSFGTVFSGILIAYGFYYAGLVIYDLNKKEKVDTGKAEEEEVDIGEIAEQVIKTQEVNKKSLSDYMPSMGNEEIEGDIMSAAVNKIDEILTMFQENPDHPDNPLSESNIAYWVKE